MNSKRARTLTAAALIAAGLTTSVSIGWALGQGGASWPRYCANHPGSKNVHCVPTTTTTTVPTTTTTSTSTTTTTTVPDTTTTTVPDTTTTTSPTTTTTTQPTGTFTGCVVVTDVDPTTIVYEGTCSGADTFVSGTTEGTITYPVSGIPACDPTAQVCRI